MSETDFDEALVGESGYAMANIIGVIGQCPLFKSGHDSAIVAGIFHPDPQEPPP